MNIYELSKQQGVTVFVTNQDLFQLQKQLQSLTDKSIYVLPGFDILPYENISPSHKITLERAKTLYQLKKADIILTNPFGLLWRLPNIPISEPLPIKKNEDFPRDIFIEFLKSNGYEQTDLVRNPGEYAVRGNLIDVFESHPYRIDFFGDTIESIKIFDFLSQRTTSHIDEMNIYPIHDLALIPKKPCCAPPDNSFYEIISKIQEGIYFGGFEFYWPIFTSQSQRLDEKIKAKFIVSCDLEDPLHQAYYFYHKYEIAKLILPPEQLYWTKEELQAFLKTATIVPFQNPGARYFTSIDEFKKFVLEASKPIIVGCDSLGVLNRMQEIFEEHDLAIACQEEFPKTFTNHKLIGTIFSIDIGFEADEYILLSDQEILGKNYFGSKQKRKANYNFFKKNFELGNGDIVVHEEHGVGQFDKLEKITVNHLTHECIKLIYADNNRLYVPVEYFDLITLYGSNDDQVSLDQLGSLSFKKRKAKTKKRINEIAKYLIEIAAQRKTQTADILIYDMQKYEVFCKKFPYILTEDQETAMEEIVHDLNSGHLMDRLICADPGFGKTEMALRAAYMLLSSGKQVAILTPTTTLAQQHYNLCKERFNDYHVVQISRFVSSADLKKAYHDIETGRAQLIIGTHGLLADKIKFANLGLLVIDEEHHFGVSQKEKIKKIYKDIHVLALSATPIPRTLQMSLSGIKAMSLIATPPINRLPIHTDVGAFDEIKFQTLVEKEYQRGGQVFFVAPRIKMLSDMKDIVKRLFPKLRVVTIHGGLNTDIIEEGLNKFENGSYDVMLATHIIEAGLNLPRANTMIIYHANKFGLAQLYQLRGRIGRSHIQSYAYLSYDSEEKLTTNAVKRLDVLKSLDQLGVGFSIATHDMDIRGYGNVIGEEQSGHIKDIGIELYQHLLEEALSKNKMNEDDFYPQINLKLNVMIPEEYIQEPHVRLSVYKILSDIHVRKELEQYRIEVEDRFGKIPESLMNLIHIVDLKILCKEAFILKLEEVPLGFYIKFYKHPSYKKMQKFLNEPWSLKHVNITKDQTFMFKVKPEWKVLKGICIKFKEFFEEETTNLQNNVMLSEEKDPETKPFLDPSLRSG